MALPAPVAFAERLAEAARPPILAQFRRQAAVTRKADASPVTAADRDAEAAMRTLVAAERPADGIHGEEDADRPAAPGAGTWVLDPVDGTRAFMAGKPTFCTLIAYVVGGVAQLGVIDQPVTGERWIAAEGRTHFAGPLPGPALGQTRGAVGLESAHLAATHPDMFTGSAAGPFARLADSVAQLDYGGDAYNYACLALGCLDLVAEAGLKAVDYAALIPVIEGAGGVITDWRGQALRPFAPPEGGTALAAGDAGLHRAALAALNAP